MTDPEEFGDVEALEAGYDYVREEREALAVMLAEGGPKTVEQIGKVILEPLNKVTRLLTHPWFQSDGELWKASNLAYAEVLKKEEKV